MPKNYRRWPHTAEAVDLKYKCDDVEYTIEIYMDSSKNENGVGSGVAIFVNGSLTPQLQYKLAQKCSDNQAEQLAIVKALIKLRDMHKVQECQWTTAIHTDSRITLKAIVNSRNHHNLDELIREEIRKLEDDRWTIHFSRVKAHDNNQGNELADQLAKEAACDNLKITYNKYTKSTVTSELKCLGLQKWQSEWDNTNRGPLTKTFWKIKDRLAKRLQMNLNLSMEGSWTQEIRVLPI